LDYSYYTAVCTDGSFVLGFTGCALLQEDLVFSSKCIATSTTALCDITVCYIKSCLVHSASGSAIFLLYRLPETLQKSLRPHTRPSSSHRDPLSRFHPPKSGEVGSAGCLVYRSTQQTRLPRQQHYEGTQSLTKPWAVMFAPLSFALL
jgi:hypothetical protein